MEAEYKKYIFKDGLNRIDEILESKNEFEEKEFVPKKEDLTYKNGKYVECVALFIDLRGSTELINKQGRTPTLAKIYRTYISESVAIINSFKTCREINIVGDGVSAVFSKKEGNDPVADSLKASSMLRTIIDVLNTKYNKKRWTNFKEIKAGIGLAKGRALVIKAGYKGSGINDLVYMGDVVNKASKMCDLANKKYDAPIVVTESVYEESNVEANETKTFQDFFDCKHHENYGYIYTGNYYRIEMHDWVEKNK